MKPLCRSLIFLLFLASLFPVRQALGKGGDQTILLDESFIQGSTFFSGQPFGGRRRRREGPVLSTSFRWEGERVEELNIPKEILDELTKPDLPFTLRDRTESAESVEGSDEKN